MIMTMNPHSNQVQNYSSSRFIRTLALGCLLISALLLVTSLAAHSAPKNNLPHSAVGAASHGALTVQLPELTR